MTNMLAAVRNLKWAASGTDGSHGKADFLENDDIRPLKLQDRTWGQVTYFTFWFSAMATVSNWYTASAAQALGLTMWEGLGCSFAGHILLAPILTYNGRPGAVYSVGYPILCRASFGIYGAWWPTLNRAVMAIVWNGVGSVQGGQCVYVMLHSIFPGIADLPNIMGKGSALDSGGLIGFFIYWMATNIFLIIPIPKMRGLIYTKLAVFIISAVAMLAWCLTLAGGLGPVATQPSVVNGSAKAWLIVRFVILGAANSATFASNSADYSRYAKRPHDVFWGNLVGFPMSSFIISMLGNIVAASSTLIFGKELVWNPLTLLDMLQVRDYSPPNRAGCFFISFMFAYCGLFTSIFENSLPAGNDTAALFPKWISVRRGMYICQIISVVMQPWYLLGSASIFISFLSSYQVFLSTITGILLCNYYIVCRGRLEVPDLYTGRKNGAYYYFHGWNIRAYVAYIIGIVPNFYGFLHNMGVWAPIDVTRFYYFAYPIGVGLSVFAFWLCNYFYPPAISFPMKEWHEPKDYIRPEEYLESPIQDEDLSSHEASVSGEEKKTANECISLA